MNAKIRELETTPQQAQYDDEDVDKLVAAATNGSITTFENLVSAHWCAVMAVGRRISGNLSDAEDIAQLTFIKVFRNIATFRKESSISTWIISIAMNEARMWKRKQTKMRETPLLSHVKDGDETPFVVEVPDSGPDPESLCLTKERSALLGRKLAQLTPDMRMALEFCDLQGNSMRTAAQLFGATAIAIKSRRRRGRVALRAKLERHLSTARTRSTPSR